MEMSQNRLATPKEKMMSGNDSASSWLHRRLPRRRVVAGGATGVAALALAGCAGTASAPTEAPATATGAPAAAATTGAAPPTAVATQVAAKRGGAFRWSIGTTEHPHLDVHQTNSYHLIWAGPGVAYSQLLRFKGGPGVPMLNFIPSPDLAESWQQPDDTTYVFKLRPGAKYHNKPPVNGREAVADDVVKSFQRQIDQKANAGLLAGIAKMEAVDKGTVRLQLSKPNADFLWALGSAPCKVVPPETWEIKGDLKEGPVIGTGPFMFDKAEKGLVTMVRNPDYFEKGLPYLDQVGFYRIPDAQTLVNSFRSKNLDIGYTGFTLGDIETLKKQFPELKTLRTTSQTRVVMGLKSDQAPFNDVRVRRAISKAINRQDVIDTIFSGGARWAPGLVVPSQDWELPEAEIKKILAYDPEGAKQLLREAGQDKGLTVDCPVGNFLAGTVVNAAELIAAQLKQVGVTLNLKPTEGVNFTSSIYVGGQYEGAYISLQLGGVPMNTDLNLIWHSGGGYNTFGLSDPELDKLIDQQAVMVKDTDGRKKVIQDIQRRILDGYPFLQVVEQTGDWVYWPYVRDFNPSIIDTNTTLVGIWLDK
jgi:peptide/nickel transport system substrate-binding protein